MNKRKTLIFTAIVVALSLTIVMSCQAPATTTPPVTTTPPATTTTIPTPTQAFIEVGARDYFFLLASITVPVGTTVTWTSMAEFDPHTVTSVTNVGGDVDGLFDSGALGTGESFSYTFNEPGTFNYICVPHLPIDMVGVVIVEPLGT